MMFDQVCFCGIYKKNFWFSKIFVFFVFIWFRQDGSYLEFVFMIEVVVKINFILEEFFLQFIYLNGGVS